MFSIVCRLLPQVLLNNRMYVMASESKTVTVIPLNGANYATWKVQCRMALIRYRAVEYSRRNRGVPSYDGG